MIVGVDKAPDGRYLVELKVVKPGLVAGASAGGGQGGGGGGQSGQPFWVATSEGKSILEALHLMRSFTPRLPFLAHNQLILIGEEVAREGVGPVLDFFLRNRETRRTTPFFVARGLAYQTLVYASPLEPSPGMNLAGIIQWEQGNIQAWLEELGDFAAALHNPWSEPVTGVVHFETHRTPRGRGAEGGQGGGGGEGGDGGQDGGQGGGAGGGPGGGGQKGEEEKHLHVSGAAVFRGDRLLGFLNREETAGLVWLRNRAHRGVLSVPAPGGRGRVEIELLTGQTRLRPRLTEGGFALTVEVKAEGNLEENTSEVILTSPQEIQFLERRAAETIRRQIEAALRKIQGEYKVDILGFGDVIYRRYPHQWLRVAKRWPELFPRVPVQTRVEFTLRRIGMVNRPVGR